VLFLDEPTTGLDPRSRLDLWQIVRDLVADGVTVLLTTQYLEEADQLADEIAVVDHGRVIATGTPAELKSRTGAQPLVVRPADAADLPVVTAIVRELTGVEPVLAGIGDRSGAAARRGPQARRRPGDRGRAGPARREPRRGVPQPHRAPRGRTSQHR
jgi:ABC-type antimicrobial peptide transport system ATPase subunit